MAAPEYAVGDVVVVRGSVAVIEEVIFAEGIMPLYRLSAGDVTMVAAGYDLTAKVDMDAAEVLSMVRVCEDCCPACRARAAQLLGEPVERCGFCGGPVLTELGPCRCMEQALAADRNKIERRARETGRPPAEIEREFLELYERRLIEQMSTPRRDR